MNKVAGGNAGLPAGLVWAVLALCAAPTALNLAGVDFSTRADAESDSPLASREVRGALVHTILEWSAFCVALVTVVFAFLHYRIKGDVAAPIIGSALFFSGMIDGFNTLAADGLIANVADQQQFIPFTWALSRTFNVCIMAAGAGLFLRRDPSPERDQGRELRLILLMGVLFGLIAYLIVQVCAIAPRLPNALFPEAVVPRPWDALPLILFLFAGGIVFPRFHRRHPSLFSRALILSVVPQVAAQLHAAFGSTALFDNHFNVAHGLKIVAYLVPLAGLILDSTRAFQAEAAHRATEAQLRVARVIQQDLLPSQSPDVPGFELAGVSNAAAAIGGDYFDYVPMPDGCLGIVIADVSGHDIGASIFMAKTRAYLRALAEADSDVERVMARLNRFLLKDAKDRRFVTMFFARLDPRKRSIAVSTAGHTGYLVDGQGTIKPLQTEGLPLGVQADAAIQCGPETPLAAGDIVVSFTDGIVEAESADGAQFGAERALEIVMANRHRSARELVDALSNSVRHFCRGAPQADDVTLVILKATKEATPR